MPTAAQLLNIGLPLWFASVFLLQPVMAAGLGFAAGYVGSLTDPEQKQFFTPLPARIYRHKSIGRRMADLAYLRKMLDEQLANLDETQKEQAKEYLRSLGYERVPL